MENVTEAKTTEKEAPTGKGNGKRKKAGLVLFFILMAAAVLGGRWWLQSQTHIATDNAFVESHIHSVASRVGGTVKSVLVTDNQPVRKGDLILEIDPADYQAQVRGASAALAMAGNETSGEYAKVEAARAEVNQSRANLQQAELDLQRGKGLFAKDVIPREQLDRLETARIVAAAQMRQKEELLRRAQAEVGLTAAGGKEARIAQRQAQLEEASLRLSYTKVYAPADGFVTKKSVEPGNYVQPGQPLMAIVSLKDAWVTANYKESQLTRLKPGQPVEFTVDTYPGKKFRGSVESIMAGTGAAFSLLPPENATGNYVKVVQRIPVRIAIDQRSDPEKLLRVGMSVVPTVIVERKLGEILLELSPFE